MTTTLVVCGSYEAALFGFKVSSEFLEQKFRQATEEREEEGSGQAGAGLDVQEDLDLEEAAKFLRSSASASSFLEPVFAYPAHRESVKCIACGPRGLLATGGADEAIKVYDVRRLRETGELSEHQGAVTGLAAFGDHMISCSVDGSIVVWKRPDAAVTDGPGPGKKLRVWTVEATLSKRSKRAGAEGNRPAVLSIAMHPTGRALLSVAKDWKLRMWNLVDGSCSYTERLHGGGDDASPYPPSQVAWTTSGDGYALVRGPTVHIRKADGSAEPLVFSEHAAAEEAPGDDDGLPAVAALAKAEILAVHFFSRHGQEMIAYGGERGLVTVRPVHFGGSGDPTPPPCVFRGHSTRIKGISSVQGASGSNAGPFLVSVDSAGLLAVWAVAEDGAPPVVLASRKVEARLTCLATCPLPAKSSAGKRKTDKAPTEEPPSPSEQAAKKSKRK